MKPEPLKDKVKENWRCDKFHFDDDILSAVEWLKDYLGEPKYYFGKFPEQLKEFWLSVGENPSIMILAETHIWMKCFNIWITDKAFQDVVIKK